MRLNLRFTSACFGGSTPAGQIGKRRRVNGASRIARRGRLEPDRREQVGEDGGVYDGGGVQARREIGG